MKRVNMPWCVVPHDLFVNESPSVSQVSEYVMVCSDS